MAFTTLADRFEEKSKEIYNRFSANGFQPVVVKPDTDGVFGSRSRIKNDTRSVPTVSVLRDTKRVSSFLNTADGRLFITKQLLLQTGNTFENTRIYNPLSPLQNVVPFVHARRHIPTQVITSIFLNPYLPGTLQPSTVNTISGKFEIVGRIQALDFSKKGFLRDIGGIAKSYIGMQLKNAIKILPSEQNYYTGRPEYKAFGYSKGELLPAFSPGPVLYDPQPISQRGIPKLGVVANIKSKLLSLVRAESIGPAFLAKRFGNRRLDIPLDLLRDPRDTSLLTTEQYKELQTKREDLFTPTTPEKPSSFVLAANEFRKSFYEKNGRGSSRLRSKYFTEFANGVDDINTTNPVVASSTATSGKTGIIDPYNFANFVSNDTTDSAGSSGNVRTSDRLNYANIEKAQQNNDLIYFYFKRMDANANPVHFRALISSIKESIKPEFNEQRYVGRTERFVTYGGAKRGLNLVFNIAAFSNKEVDGMWSRVNYLSGLAFPIDVKNGFMIPPLFKLSIGGLYDDQPCYIESLDYDFLDETITFNNRQVPFAVNVNMQLSILEKRSKFYDSPFYKITEQAEQTIRDRQREVEDILGIVRL